MSYLDSLILDAEKMFIGTSNIKHTYNAEQIRSVGESLIKEIRRLKTDAGLMQIEIDHRKTLLASCEKSLRERDSKLNEVRL